MDKKRRLGIKIKLTKKTSIEFAAFYPDCWTVTIHRNGGFEAANLDPSILTNLAIFILERQRSLAEDPNQFEEYTTEFRLPDGQIARIPNPMEDE